MEGRFPQVAGVSFGFDPTRPPGQRIGMDVVRVQGEFLQLDKVSWCVYVCVCVCVWGVTVYMRQCECDFMCACV